MREKLFAVDRILRRERKYVFGVCVRPAWCGCQAETGRRVLGGCMCLCMCVCVCVCVCV